MVTFVRKATKKSLLTMLRKAEKITPRLLAKLFEGVLFKDEFETFSAGGGTDHGSLGGLSDDDHPQYPLETDVDYALVSGNDAGTNVTAAELEELTDESTTTLHSHALGGVAGPVCLDSYIDIKSRQTEWSLHGGITVIDTAHDLSGGDLVTTVGIGKVLIAVIAGSDVAGSITVTGTSVDRETGAETGADVDTLTIDAVTTDGSDTDADGNTRHSFTGAYLTSKWYKGSITIASSDTTITDMDTYQVSFEQWNDTDDVVINTLDVTAYANNASASMYGYLYSLVVTGDKCTITRETSVELPTADVSSGKYYRLRRGNLDVEIDGSTDGFWVDFFPDPLNQNYWEDVNIKVWGAVGSSETTVTGYEISGTITGSPAISGVTVTLSGDAADVTATNASGEYTFSNVANGSYTVTPTKTGYTFSPTSTAITVSNGDQTGKDFTGSVDAIVLPFTIDFESETVGLMPSYVNAWTGRDDPAVQLIGSTVEGYTKCLKFDKGADLELGAGAIDIAAALGGYAAGAGVIATGGLRMQLLEKRGDETKGRQTWYVASGNDELDTASTDVVYFGDREENDPDTLRLLLKKVSTSYDTGAVVQTGIDNTTGDVWRYTRFEFTVDGGLTCYVYDTAGSQQGTEHSCDWPTDGETPIVQLPYLETSAGAGFNYQIAEIWVGDSGDAWPSM